MPARPIALGGTGATTEAAARTALGVPATAHVHSAADITSGTIATARLGSGTPDATTFLRGDQTYAAPASAAHASSHLPGGSDALTTAAPAATGVATASAVGVAVSFARSDHAHQSNTAPGNVTKAAAAIGTSGEPARADHKHDVTTAAASANPPGTANAEGVATSLARSDHTHALAAFGSGAATFCEGNDARLSDSRTPTSHAASHNAGGGDALAIDAAAGTGSLRTIGTGALTACAGNDARLSDSRTPLAHVHNATTDITSGTVPTARLGSGTANSSTFLRGDQTWAAPTATVSNPRTIVSSTTLTAGDSNVIMGVMEVAAGITYEVGALAELGVA